MSFKTTTISYTFPTIESLPFSDVRIWVLDELYSSISGLKTVHNLPVRSYILPYYDCFRCHDFACVEQQAHMFNIGVPDIRLYDSSALRLHIVGGFYTPLPIVRIQWFPGNLLYILLLYWPMGLTRRTREHPCSPSLHFACLFMKLTFLCKCAYHVRVGSTFTFSYTWAAWPGPPPLLPFTVLGHLQL